MIEMRWVPVKNSQSLSSASKDTPSVKNDYGEYFVLQYRPAPSIGTETSWVDVPTVTEP